LKLQCDEPLSNFAFNFNVRRYTEGLLAEGEGGEPLGQGGDRHRKNVTATRVVEDTASRAPGRGEL
jgi:hypothetical protein